MPELPEVTTVINILKEEVLNKTIDDVVVFRDKNLLNEKQYFIDSLKGKTILDIHRLGKYIIFMLSDDYVLIVHLRMEGKFFYSSTERKTNKHDIVKFIFKDLDSLTYNDVRKFGILKVSKTSYYLVEPPLANVGSEPFDINDSNYLIDKYKNLNKPIKEVLLDQSIISGIGNIYADEILFASKVHPLTLAKDLNKEEIEAILANSKTILNRAISLGGSTIKSYHPKEGISGLFQEELNVYNKKDQLCPCCHTPLKKIKVNGRGTTFCPKEQIRKNYPKVIAITGAIASGKSSVCQHLKQKGYQIIDADEITHNLYKDEAFIKKLQSIVPFKIEKEVDRNLLKEAMLNNPSIKKKVEELVFQEVYLRMKALLKKRQPNELIVLDVPLLFASHIDELVDEIYIIRTPKERQIENLKTRGVDIDSYLKLNENYLNQEKEKEATKVILNDNDLASLFKKIDSIFGTN